MIPLFMGNYNHHLKVNAEIRLLKCKPCADCGNTFHHACMDFDHVRGVKKFNISAAGHNYGIRTILKEVKKCDIVCANCHRLRTYRRRL